MKKFLSDLISLGFIALMALSLFKGISVLLGYENPISSAGLMSMEAAWALVMVTSSAVIFLEPVLVSMYYRLAKREEKEAMEAFGERYEEYRRQVPMFLPFLRRNTGSQVVL